MKTRFLLFACAALVLSGCSTWLVDPVSPPDDSSLHATYVGSGNQQFQCVADKRGYYWRFVAPEVLIRDASGNVFAKQGADFTFRAADGSYLKATISAADTSGSNSRMKNVLFEVTPRRNSFAISLGQAHRCHWRHSDNPLPSQYARNFSESSVSRDIRLLSLIFACLPHTENKIFL